MKPLILEDFKSLFKSEDAFKEFVVLMKAQFTNDLSPVMAGGAILGANLSPEATKEVLYERMSRSLAMTPSILDDVKERLENDELLEE